jgi:hypothetical protein
VFFPIWVIFKHLGDSVDDVESKLSRSFSFDYSFVMLRT